MKLYKLLVVNALVWGIPGIFSYVTYAITQPYIKNVYDLTGQVAAILIVYIITLVANYFMFWENYYDNYLKHDEEKPKTTKSEKEKLL